MQLAVSRVGELCCSALYNPVCQRFNIDRVTLTIASPDIYALAAQGCLSLHLGRHNERRMLARFAAHSFGWSVSSAA